MAVSRELNALAIAPSFPAVVPSKQPCKKALIDLSGIHNLRKKREKLLHTETELQTPTTNPLTSICDGGSIWKYRETSVKKLLRRPQQATPSMPSATMILTSHS
eukprot:1140059-Pelagomonas_calceolata.AAC.4